MYFAGLVFAICWFLFVAYLLISGSKRVKRRSENRDSITIKNYESIVSKFMYVTGIILIFMLFIGLLSAILK